MATEKNAQYILGVKIDFIAKETARQQVKDFLTNGGQHTIFTPNPEMLVAAERDEYFRGILNESSLNLCDGRGVELAIKLLNKNPSLSPPKDGSALVDRGGQGSGYEKVRITGIDFMLDICALAAEQGRGVYLLGSGDQSAVRTVAENLKRKLSQLKIVGYHPGPELRITNYELRYNAEENDKIIDDIIMTSPDILFVAFGHEKQEKWIYEHLPQLPSVKIAMGVGGAFDVLGGKLKRAPLWMQRAGLEWLWRLIQEPKRIKRIWTAVIVFPYLVIKNSKIA